LALLAFLAVLLFVFAVAPSPFLLAIAKFRVSPASG